MKFIVDGNKDESMGVIINYLSWEIQFHTSETDCPHQFWKKIKTLFDKVDEIHVMKLEKELISLDPHYLENIEDYLARVKELHLKLGECGNNY